MHRNGESSVRDERVAQALNSFLRWEMQELAVRASVGYFGLSRKNGSKTVRVADLN